MQSCVIDVNNWLLINKLQLNEDKTEALLLDSSQSENLPVSLQIGQTCVHFADSAHNLGVIFDSSLIYERSGFTLEELDLSGSILPLKPQNPWSPPLSSLNYCNALLAGVFQKHLAKLQRVMNCAARFVCRSSKCEHISSLLADLHWLPVCHRLEYKITTVCYNVILGSAPPYLADFLLLYTPSWSLYSSADSCIFRIPIRCKKFLQ